MPTPIAWERPNDSFFDRPMLRVSRGEKLEQAMSRWLARTGDALWLFGACCYFAAAFLSASLHPELVSRGSSGTGWARLGSGLLLLAIYLLARRYVSPVYGLTAALLVLFLVGTGPDSARYTALLTLCVLGLGCWLQASGGKDRFIWLAGVAVFVAAAICVDPAGWLLLVSLAAGEAIRTMTDRRLRAGAWAALSVVGLPLFHWPFPPVVHRVIGSGVASSAQHSLLSDSNLISSGKWLAVVAMLLCLIWLVRNRLPLWLDSPRYQPFRAPLPERLAWFTLLASSGFGFILALAKGVQNAGDAVLLTLPVTLLLALGAYRTFRGAAVPGLVTLGLTLSAIAKNLLAGSLS